MIQSQWKERLVVSAIAVIVAVAGTLGFAWIVLDKGGTGSVEFVVSEGKAVRINIANGKIHFIDILTKIMGQDEPKSKEMRSIALSILAVRYDVYEYGTPLLVERIGREQANTDYAREFVKLLEQRRGPFENSAYYDLDDPDTVHAISKLKYDHPFARELRQEIMDGLANLWPQDFMVTTLFSPDIPVGMAAVCDKSEFRGNKIRLFKPVPGIAIKVFGKFPLARKECVENPNKILQVSVKDGERLLRGATLRRSEEAFAKAEPRHQTEDPVSPILAAAFKTRTRK